MVKRNASAPMLGDAFGEEFFRGFFHFRRGFGFAQAGGTFYQQFFQVDAVNQIHRVDDVASDLDIFLPSWSRTMPWMYTSLNGTLPVKWVVIIIMRATQKKMIS